MKKIFNIGLLFLLNVFFILPINADAYVNVKGYTKKNGTYVAPHVRSNPNGLKYDNYSYTSSQGLYNSSYGTKGSIWDTPTYVTDPSYYVGKSIYDNNQTTYGTPISSYDTYSVNSYPSQTVTYKSTDFKSNITIPYVVKYWADSSPTISCDNSAFLTTADKFTCNDYRNNKDKFNWVTTNFKETENYTVYQNQLYSCTGSYKIASSTISKPTCVIR